MEALLKYQTEVEGFFGDNANHEIKDRRLPSRRCIWFDQLDKLEAGEFLMESQRICELVQGDSYSLRLKVFPNGLGLLQWDPLGDDGAVELELSTPVATPVAQARRRGVKMNSGECTIVAGSRLGVIDSVEVILPFDAKFKEFNTEFFDQASISVAKNILRESWLATLVVCPQVNKWLNREKDN